MKPMLDMAVDMAVGLLEELQLSISVSICTEISQIASM